ncbi:MAG: FAD-dependent oxidoreductase [Betaproteobacteria bacterium HGW-Betaproteobacteria-17]|nr:MAG: FAD-dependent oxidoreductase [Betaproteobacteria bacterium HGW-Betaproteobacteria-17]
MSAPVVIVGTGLAGYNLAREWRKLDSETPLLLITADDGRSYSKPMLSTGFGKNKDADGLSMAEPGAMAEQLKAEVRTHTRISGIDPGHKQLWIGEEAVPYRDLILAWGAEPIRVPVAGDAQDAILPINDLEDYARFRTAAAGKQRLLLLGAGLIGCEFANDLVHAGFAVDVAHLGAWPLERLLPVEAGQRLADSLAALGVNWHFGRTGKSVEATAAGYAVTLDNGEIVAADVVLSAIGLRPRTQLAKAAGIPVGRGIQTNGLLETGAAHVYAMGDCAEVEGLNQPYVQPLMVQARALAATLTGTPTPVVYPAMPVMVKTPAHPVAVLPPKIGAVGGWQVECSDTGVCALHVDEAGRLQGFALTGSETGRRNALAKEVAA